LASWKIGKNATTIAWKKAAVIIKKRKDQGKESEICIDGKLIPSKKMKKEIARHWPSYLECIEMEGKSSSAINLTILLISLSKPTR
jgi:hypothetical protein